MLFKLIALALMALQINACCLPDSFQFTALTDTHYGMNRFRARVIVAADAYQGRAAIISFSKDGQRNIYADFRSGMAYRYSPSRGCRQGPIDAKLLRQLNETRCAPTNLLNEPPIGLKIGGADVTLYSGRIPFRDFSVDVDAVVSDLCEPVFFKISGPRFQSINIFGNFAPAPESGILDLPEECRRNATLSRKRDIGDSNDAIPGFNAGAIEDLNDSA